MELRHLRYFVAVAEEGGITRAAARLHVSQPPLSRQIRALEEDLGVRLVDRDARPIALTPAGRLFFQEARAILQRVDDAVRRVRELPDESAGEIRVGYSPVPSTELLPRVLQIHRMTHPQVRVVLLDLASTEILSQIKARELDLAIAVRPLLKKSDGLDFEPLAEMPIGVLVPNDHAFAGRRSVTAEEALAQPLIAFARADYPDYHAWLNGVIRRSGRKPRIVAYADGATSLMAAVQAGQGVAFGPPTYAEAAGKRATYLPILPEVQPIVLGAILRSGKRSALEEGFLESLRAGAGT